MILDGRHRFSRYRLDFLIDQTHSGSVVHARSYAAFPGRLGAIYRGLVIGSRGHVVAVRHMLNSIARRAERGGDVDPK